MVGGVSLALGLRGWEITRLWFWLLGSALLVLVGLQLTISWILMRVLEALSEREVRIDEEMRAAYRWRWVEEHGILQELAERLTHSLKVTLSSIATLDEQENALIVQAVCPIRRLKGASPVGRRIHLGDAPTYQQVLRKGIPVLFRQHEPAARIPPQELELTLVDGLRSGALLPVKFNGKVIGVVSLGEMRAWERTPFTEEKLKQGLTLVTQWAQTFVVRGRER